MIARAGELAAIERFVAASADHSSVLVLEGEPGIGKTTLWEAAVAAARQRRLRILAARASGAEAHLCFAGLTDLLAEVDEGAYAGLPEPQRLALDAALLRAVPDDDTPLERLAIGLGLLNLLRALAGPGPLLVALDDLQWQDSASTEVLAFASRRLDREAVSFLIATRPGDPSELERALERRRPERLHVGPLGLAATAERLADEVGSRAPEHDREGTYPLESFATVKRAGYFGAPIPEELGGLGVTAVHDVLVASTRLARGDASLTLGVNMHLAYVQNVVRRWRAAVAAGDERRAVALGRSLREIAADGVVFASAVSEARQDLTRPATTATRTPDGWIVSGRKVFSTMSEAADVLYTAVTFADDGGGERYGYAMVPRATPGVVVHHDWDALGMRASGSHTISFEDVRLPAAALRGGFPVGDATAYVERNLDAGLLHAAVTLGVAEAADLHVRGRLASFGGDPDARTRMLAAENVVDLSACRAVLSRAATLIDDHFDAQTGADLMSLFAEAQAAKAFIGEAAVRIVDRALALSGGGGYLNGSPLARAYRDVRAGAFMHPLGANRAYELLGGLALGRDASFH